MLMVAAIFIYIIAIIFRLLDNSASLLINHGISVSPFYLNSSVIKTQIDQLKNKNLIKKLQRNLWYQKLHTFFSVVAIVAFVIGLLYEIYEPSIIYLM